MKCDLIKDKLLENFGLLEMPDYVTAHLDECDECRLYYQELLDIKSNVDREDEFYLSQQDQEQFMVQVEQKIDKHELGKVTNVTPKWKLYIPVAAAIVMILGIALISQIPNLFNGSDQTDITEIDENLWIKIDNAEIEFVNNDNLENVLIDYSSVESSINDEWMIDDVTEEEYQYLLDNFDIGEIL